MGRFDGIFESQWKALLRLDEFLMDSQRGRVYVAVSMPIHAKVSYFARTAKPSSAILGSSNLSGLLAAFRQYEIDCLVSDDKSVGQLGEMARAIRDHASLPISEVKALVKVLENPNLILDGVPNVERIDTSGIEVRKTNISFELPLKAAPHAPKSNLNVYFGASKNKGSKVPRSWYELEIIVDTDITELPGYPEKNTKFEIITDDGWRFPCEVQGDNAKNLRSAGDLKTLGKWFKERLQNAGALELGDLVTIETLQKYGRDSVTFTKLDEPDLWFLDFSRKMF
jgi:hypothetical protein